ALRLVARGRVVDIVVASVLGVAMGLVFTVWNLGWTPISGALAFFRRRPRCSWACGCPQASSVAW
ncbi:MAG: hypothetical protein PGN11_11985, partial [Quadrisphaera sp.]